MVEAMSFLDGEPQIWLGDAIFHFHDMEHRPALPMIIWYIDRQLFSSVGLLPLILSHIALTITAILTIKSWAPRVKSCQIYTWILPTGALALFFSLLNWYNLMWEKQLHVSMSLMFLVMAAKYTAAYEQGRLGKKKTNNSQDLLKINIFCWLSAYSFGYGILTLCVVILYGVLLRWPIKHVLYCLFSTALLFITYLSLLSLRDQGLDGLVSTSPDIGNMIRYTAGVIGGVFGSIGGDSLLNMQPKTLAFSAGIVLLGVYFYATVANLLGQTALHYHTPSYSSSFVITTSCIGMAIITWLSRPIETGGLVDRYIIVSTLFLLSIPGLLLSKNKWLKKKPIIVILGILFLIISILGHKSNYIYINQKWHFSTVSAIGTDLGVYIPGPNNFAPPLHQSKERTFAVWNKHRHRLEKIEGDYPFVWYQKPLENIFSLHKEKPCVGGVEKLESVKGYKDIKTFVSWSKMNSIDFINIDWVVVANRKGLIIGLGSTRRPLEITIPSKLSHEENNKMFSGFMGHAGFITGNPGDFLKFYLVSKTNLCKFAEIKY